MEIYLKLFLVGAVPVLLSVAVFLLKKYFKPFANLPYIASQIIIGVLFGVVSILGTELGVPLNVGGAIANARDSSPICAGLLFGGPSGIIAGLIGGGYRYLRCFILAIPLGNDYSRTACSIATIFAGVFSAILRKYMFENKSPNFIFGFFTALVVEVIHMVLLFLTHMNSVSQALGVIKICTIPMIVCNGVSVMLAVIVLSLLDSDRKNNFKLSKQINKQIQLWLLVDVVIAFIATSIFAFRIQTNTLEINASANISTALSDVKQQMLYTDIERVAEARHIGNDGYVLVADKDQKILSDAIAHEKQNIGKTLEEVGLSGFLNNSTNVLYRCDILGQPCYYMYDKIVVTGDTYYLIGVIGTDEVHETRQNSIYVNSFMEVVVFAFLFFMIYELIKRLVVTNVKKINGDLNKIINGDLTVEVNVDSSEEFKLLSADINTTVGSLKQYIDEANTRIDKELEFAKNIQHSSLQSVFPPYPNRKEFEIFATMDTAKQVGGDFYDFYMLDNDRLAFLIADVSGKGIPAAMFMMTAKTIIKSLVETGITVNEIFERANEKLCEGNTAGMFVTAWLGILDLKTGRLDYVNAGHNPPFVYRNGKYEMLKCKAGFVLAGMEGIKYKAQSVELNEGDRIFLYTDGVTEANNVERELYGEERLEKYLNANTEYSVEQLLEGVKKDVDSFVGDADQFDDITMLCLYFSKKCVEASVKKSFVAKPETFDGASMFLERELEKANVEGKTKMQISVAFEEIFVNIARYAYDGKDGTVDIEIKCDKDLVSVTFADSGKPFNPLLKEDADITLSAEERKIGGLGILMVKKMMDDVLYSYVDGHNVLTIIKKLK